jgi:amidase
MTGFAEYDQNDGLGLAELVCNRQVSAREVVEEAIARIEALNPRLNAVVLKMYDRARAEVARGLPDGPFHAVPFLLKDLLSMVAGVPTSCGTRLLKDLPAPRDSEIVRRYRASGVVMLGKTNAPELGIVPVTEPALFGPCRNPWDLSLTPGGSSGGSAAAVAARLVPLAGGGDGGGSIRIPASCCGLFGLKVSRGRTPTGPDFGEVWHGFAFEHVVTRSVRDSAAMLDAIQGADVGAPYAAPQRERPFLEEVTTEPGRLRIAFTARPFLGRRVHDDCVAGLNAAAALLEQLGHRVEEAAPDVDRDGFAVAFLTVLMGEARADIEWVANLVGTKPRAGDFEPETYALGLLGRSMSAGEYAAAARRLQMASRGIARFFERYDVLLTPTLASPPLPIGALQPSAAERAVLKTAGRMNAGWLLKALGVVGPMAERTFDWVPYTPVFNVTGQPAMSVPLHWNADGLPIGMHFAARFGEEGLLFRLAGQLERAAPWGDRRPPLAAA